MADLLALSGDREVLKVTARRNSDHQSACHEIHRSLGGRVDQIRELDHSRPGRTQNLLCLKRPPVLNTWNSNSTRARFEGSWATAGTVCLELNSRPCRHESFQPGKTSEGQEDRDGPVRWRFANASWVGEGKKEGRKTVAPEFKQFLFSCHRLKQREDSASSREQPRRGEGGDWAAASRIRRVRLSAAGGPRTGRPMATPMALAEDKRESTGVKSVNARAAWPFRRPE